MKNLTNYNAALSQLTLYAEIINPNNECLTYIIIFGGFLFNYQLISPIFEDMNNIIFIDSNQFDSKTKLVQLYQLLNNFIFAHNKNVRKKSINYNTPAIVCGFSYGGLLAINFFANYKLSSAKLILLNSTPCFISKNLWDGIAQQDFVNLATKLENFDLNQFNRYFFNLCSLSSNRSTTKEHEKPYKQTLQLTPANKDIFSKYAKKNNLKFNLEQIYDMDLRKTLQLIQQKCLIIQSEYDILIPTSNKAYYQQLKNNIIVQKTLTTHINFANINIKSIINKFIAH